MTMLLRFRRSRRAAVIAACAAIAPLALAVEFNDDNDGAWNSAGTWTGGAGFPDNGDATDDHVILNSEDVEVTADVTFGDAANNSTFAGGDLDINPGVTLTHAAGSTINYTGGLQFTGSGTFENAGVFNHNTAGEVDMRGVGGSQGGNLLDGPDQNGVTFLNTGTYNFNSNNADFDLDSGGSTVINQGIISVADNVAGRIQRKGRFINDGGTINVGENAELQFDSGFGELTGTSTGGVFNVGSGSQIQFGGSLTFTGTYTGNGAGNVLVSDVGSDEEFRIGAGGAIFNIDDGTNSTTSGGFGMEGGQIDPKGNTLTNRGKFILTGGKIDGDSGEFRNEGWFIHTNTTFDFTGDGNDQGGGPAADLVNAAGGTYQFLDDGDVDLDNIGSMFTNEGLLLKTGPGESRIFRKGAFDNSGGTIEVREGELEFDSANGTLEISFGGVEPGAGGGKTLTSGTYRVFDNTELDMNAEIGPDKFSTIGATATVDLRGPNSEFDAIDTVDTVQGTFLLSDGREWDHDLTLDGGTLGGDGGIVDGNVISIGNAVVSPGLNPGEAATLSVNSDMTFAGSDTFVVDLNSLANDLLSVGADTELNSATLNVNLDHDPLLDDMFVILESEVLIGMFNGLADGTEFFVNSNTSGEAYGLTINYFEDFEQSSTDVVKLTVTTVPTDEEAAPAVPEPATAMTALLAFAAFTGRRRR